MLKQIENKHLLIDGDIVKYRCAASAEKTKYLVEWGHTEEIFYERFDTHKEVKEFELNHDCLVWSRKEVQPLEFALQACKTTLDSFFNKLKPDGISIFLSPERNFRHLKARTKPYKGNRTAPKPKYLKDCEKFLIDGYKAVVVDGIEADDAIGQKLYALGPRAVSVSIDKDLLQVPGWHYNWVDDTVRWVSPKEGDFNFYSQLLTGDVTDNIPGLPGCGPKGATELLTGANSRAELASRVWGEYKRKLVNPSEPNSLEECQRYFCEQADLIWIRRTEGSGYVCPVPLE